jgi:hypothetical protein
MTANKNTSTGGIPYADKLGTAGINPLPASDAAGVLEDVDPGRVTARSAADDFKIAIHEGSHCVGGRAMGASFGGVTIEPTVAGVGLAGRAWGSGGHPTGKLEDLSKFPIVEQIASIMPAVGEDRTAAAAIFQHVHSRVVELLAGGMGEKLFFPDQPVMTAFYDTNEAAAFAALICSTPKSVEAFLEFARVEAFEILSQHKTAVLVVANALIEQRTLAAEEIDNCIATAEAQDGAAEARDGLIAETARRDRWRRCITNAETFKTFMGDS